MGAVVMTGATRFAVLVGGALGTLLRTALAEFGGAGTADWPWGTLMANLLGTALLGLVVGWLDGRPPDPRWLPVTGGLLGATTTFSTFAVEGGRLAAHEPALGLAYVVASVATGLALLTAARRVGRDLAREHGAARR